MMNVLQIQDDLKNFSEDQLIREMQQPSGSAPQFLILSELNRRKRVKGEFAARQAQNAPTVAEEVVAAAGVPQSGMMGMSEAMAPASVESGGIGSMMPKTMKMGGEIDSYAEGGVIRAQDGLPDEESYLSKFFGALNPDKETVEKRIAESNPLGFGPVLRSPATDATLAKLEEEEKPTKATTEEKKEDTDAIIDSGADTPTTPKPLTIQEELLKRQAGLEKDRDFDRYMALAQAGLGILASDKPTLAGAVGEGGMKGLDAFREANKRYEEGLTDILNARVKLASKNTGLSQKDAISAIGVIDRTISNLRKEAEKSFDETALAKIERDIAQLRFQKRALMPRAGFGYLDIDVSDSTASKG